MMLASALIEKIRDGEYDSRLTDLYADASMLSMQKERYMEALHRFIELYGDQEASVFTAAGRSEVSGNHTDHQHGRVLAASVNLDSIAVAAPCSENEIQVVSDGFEISPVDLSSLDPDASEEGTSESLIRGVAAALQQEGWKIGGFKAYVTSNVAAGAGLSSSASFEVLIGTILSGLYNGDTIDMVTIARAGQKAENQYFNKPCGLMDQCACAVGGLITIDFQDPEHPEVREVKADFGKFGYSLCITDTKGSHADLTHEYAAVPDEMKQVARILGKEVLRDVKEEDLYAHLPQIRQEAGDRAVLRALHFFNENHRVAAVVHALESGSFDEFLKGIQDSGNSSFKYLQNVYASSDPVNQAVSLGLARSEELLEGGHGVCRVHGGGFAGTIQAFVEDGYVPVYKEEMEKIFGSGSCHVLKVRKQGGTRIF